MLKPDGTLQRKVLRSWEPSGAHLKDWPQQGAPQAEAQASGREGDGSRNVDAPTKDSTPLRDHEIRASLTKHFGLLETALEDEDLASCKSPEYDTVFEDSGSSSGESTFLLEEEDEEEDDDGEEDSGVSPPRSDHCPYQSPPRKASRRLCSRSRSSSGSSSCPSRSPATRRTFRYGWVGGLRMGGGQLSTPSSEVSGERGALRPGPQLPVWPVSWSEALEVDSWGSYGQVLKPSEACCVVQWSREEWSRSPGLQGGRKHTFWLFVTLFICFCFYICKMGRFFCKYIQLAFE